MSALEVRNLRVLFRQEGAEAPRRERPFQPLWGPLGRLRKPRRKPADDKSLVMAVDEVSFELEEGETLGLVGESGSGKSVTALAILGLLPVPPALVPTGEAWLGGRNLLALAPRELRRARWSEIAMIFQDPLGALNPFLPVGLQIAEVFEVHRGLSRREALARSASALGEVGIPRPEERLEDFPHQLSGGQRQRVGIAMALACGPKVLLADEPTTALDVTLQAQVLELLKTLQKEHGTAILLITHDLGVVARACDRVHVMYAGRLVEVGATGDVLRQPFHPYTLGLLTSLPNLRGPLVERLASIPGAPPDPAHLPRGCPFHPRCAFRVDACTSERPPLEHLQVASAETLRAARLLFVGGRRAACLEKENVALLSGAWSAAPRDEERSDRPFGPSGSFGSVPT